MPFSSVFVSADLSAIAAVPYSVTNLLWRRDQTKTNTQIHLLNIHNSPANTQIKPKPTHNQSFTDQIKP
jgi:hypothetical protein